MTASARTHHTERRKLRRRLQAQGLPDGEIEARVEALRQAQGRALSPLVAPAPQPRPPGQLDRATQRAALRPQVNGDRKRFENGQRVARLEWEERQREIQDQIYVRLSPDDRGFRPSRPDPLTTGPARLTGTSARAAKRGMGVTKWQYDAMEAKAEEKAE